MRRFFWLVVMLAALVAPAQAQSPKQQLRTLQEQAMVAYKAGNFAECAKNFAAALAIRPHHPRLLYNFAACSAKAGKPSEALRALTEYADMGLIAPVEQDEDFSALKGTPAFNALLDKMRANGKPIGESKIVARLNERFLAEGLAWDDAGKRFFVSSVDQRRILQVTEDGRSSNFVTSSEAWILGAFGMALNPRTRTLWVAMSGVAHARALQDAERDSACVTFFSLQNKENSLPTCWPPINGKAHVIGDIFVAADDVVFASDSLQPTIYASPLEAPAKGGAAWLESDAFGSLQGITATPDEKALIVADYARGLHVIDRATKAIETIDYAGGTTLLGIDGLYRVGNQLIAIQNGVVPTRILSMTLDASGRNIAAVKVISANDPNIPEPSLGTIKGNEFCVIANAQWSRFTDDGTRKQDLDPVHITCIALK